MKRRTFLAGIAAAPIAAALPAWSAPIDPDFPYIRREIEAMTRAQQAQVQSLSLHDTAAERDAWLELMKNATDEQLARMGGIPRLPLHTRRA